MSVFLNCSDTDYKAKRETGMWEAEGDCQPVEYSSQLCYNVFIAFSSGKLSYTLVLLITNHSTDVLRRKFFMLSDEVSRRGCINALI